MTVACLTDEMVERYGLFDLGIIRMVANRLREEERIRSAVRLGQAPAAALDEPRPAGRFWARADNEPDRLVVFLPRAAPRFTIQLGHNGVDAIRREILWGAAENVETGGFLWASERSQYPGAIEITYVSEPAPDSLHGPTAARLGRPEDVKATWPDWRLRSRLQVAGCWHLHPLGDGTPSATDRQAWAGRVEDSGTPLWASLIAIRGEDGFGWSQPRFTGWITYPNQPPGHLGAPRSYICEPAEIAGVF